MISLDTTFLWGLDISKEHDFIPHELAKSVPMYGYIGAGLSMNAGMPSWWQMTDMLITYLTDVECAGCRDDYRFQDEADICRFMQLFAAESATVNGKTYPILSAESDDPRVFGRAAILNMAFRYRHGNRQMLLPGGKPNPRFRPRAGKPPSSEDLAMHSMLWSAGIHGIITPNYDVLLERAHSFYNHVEDVRSYRYNAEFIGLVRSSPRFVLKLHGDINDLSSMCLDPVSAWTRSDQLGGTFGKRIKRFYSEINRDSIIVYLGLGFRDHSIAELHRAWRKTNSSGGMRIAVMLRSEMANTLASWDALPGGRSTFDDILFAVVNDNDVPATFKGSLAGQACVELLELLNQVRDLRQIHRPSFQAARTIYKRLYGRKQSES